MTTFSTCPSCGVPWVDHLGLVGTCAKLQEAMEALRVARTWLAVDGNDPDMVKLAMEKIDRTLEGLR